MTARDGAPDPRLATATVTVHIIDVEDEVPIFHQSSYEASVKENVPDYMVVQVTVRVHTYRKPFLLEIIIYPFYHHDLSNFIFRNVINFFHLYFIVVPVKK